MIDISETNYYSLVEEPEFQQAIDELEESHPRIVEIKEGISTHLSRSPKKFIPIEGTIGAFFTLKTDDWNIEDVPTVQVVYFVDEEKHIVYLLTLRIINLTS